MTQINDQDDEMRSEYDLSQLGRGVRGKYAAAMRQGYSVIVHHADGTSTTRFVSPTDPMNAADHSQSPNEKPHTWQGDRVSGDKVMGDKVGGDKVSGDKISYTNHLQGANIANFANEVKDNARQQANQHIHQPANQDLAQAAKAIKTLLDQLDQDYDRTTPSGQAMISAKTIESIENNPTLKARVINALKAGGTTALESAIDHPAVKPVVAMLKGFMDAK